MSESFHFSYENKIRIKSSFSGSDLLTTVIESGNAFDSPLNLDLQSKKGDFLKTSEIYYKFSVGKDSKITIGPKMFGYVGLGGKSTVFNERVAILDGSNYTTSAGLGPGVAFSSNKKNGLNYSVKLASSNVEFNDESKHIIGQVGLTKEYFGGTITGNSSDDFDAYGIAIFFKPDNFPSISASIEEKETNSSIITRNWVIGSQKKFNNKTVGIAIGTHNEKEKVAYESWCIFEINDKFKIIPVLFIRDKTPKKDIGLAFNLKLKY